MNTHINKNNYNNHKNYNSYNSYNSYNNYNNHNNYNNSYVNGNDIYQEPIKVFDIVSAPYMTIQGERKIGLFLVIYMEANDNNDFNNRNLTGLKLTSKDLYANVYRTLVTTNDVPRLTKDSYVYANKPSTLLKDACRFVGRLPVHLCEEVLKNLSTYLHEISTQSLTALVNKLKTDIKRLRGV